LTELLVLHLESQNAEGLIGPADYVLPGDLFYPGEEREADSALLVERGDREDPALGADKGEDRARGAQRGKVEGAADCREGKAALGRVAREGLVGGGNEGVRVIGEAERVARSG